ncbi:MAG: prepilin-type N-terminal cleavage/methylation domain-containing protein [Candidatus Gracilibacteria bacterium]|nr:prepilin-type N-terminal cleavage/methylation domain-containing protein [Candidatus Gracilibacteria bacterium]
MNKQKQAFTLVELIVVITILAILATIAFISLSGYSQDARNSIRAADIKTIEKALQVYATRNSIYLAPESAQTVSYSGDTVYYQGTFGDSPYKEVGNLSNIPLDPLTKEEYIYSTTANYTQYEILAIYEGEIVYQSQSPHSVSTSLQLQDSRASTPSFTCPKGREVATSIISKANAAETYKPKVNGTYNKIYVKTQNYYVPLPSIINAEVTSATGIILDENNIKSQVVTNGNNLPQVGTTIDQTKENLTINFAPYYGSITSTSTDEQKIELAQKIQQAYSGSDLQTQAIYSNIINKPENELVSLINSIVLGQGSNNTVAETIITPTFPTTCGNGETITYQEAQDNKATILSNINNYIGCNISDYPGGAARIAGTTVSSKVLVVGNSDDSSGIQWGYYGITTNAISTTDGYNNTSFINGTSGTAGYLCWNKYSTTPGTWYLPAKDELNTIYTNKSSLGAFTNSGYWSSTEYGSNNARRQLFFDGYQRTGYKSTGIYVRCSSRF